MSSKKVRLPQLVGIRKTDLAVVEIIFSGIPGDRDLDLMTTVLEALGYEVSVDREFSNAAKPGHLKYSDGQIVIQPDVDDYPRYRRRGTEDTGPAEPQKFSGPAQGDQSIEA